MPTSEIEVLRKENSEIANQFRELISQAKYLVQVVDSLKRENGHMMNIITNLRLSRAVEGVPRPGRCGLHLWSS